MDWTEISISLISGGVAGIGAAFALFKWWLAYRKDKELQEERHVHEKMVKDLMHTHQLELQKLSHQNSIDQFERFEKFKLGTVCTNPPPMCSAR